MDCSDRLSPEKILDSLKTRFVGRKVLVFSSTSSTNDIAWEYAKNPDNDGLVVFAETQNKGRGRAGNAWIDEPGKSILCSIVFSALNNNPEFLTLLFAVAVADAIGSCRGKQAKIKWPNDIFLNDKKLAGLLIESKKIKGQTVYVLGIGINCHQPKEFFSNDQQFPATSIDIETGSFCDRITLAKRLFVSIEDWLSVAGENAPLVIEHWTDLSMQLGKRLTLISNNEKYTGQCLGIDPQEGLILKLDTGAVRIFDAAHTRIVRFT